MSEYTRAETYLSAIANGSTDVPEPYTREEKLLAQIAQGGGGGSLPTATTAGDVPAWDADNSEWTTLAKGSIASENAGYVTGGDVYTVVGNVESALDALIGGTVE